MEKENLKVLSITYLDNSFSDMVHRSRYKNAVQPYTQYSKVEYYLLLN